MNIIEALKETGMARWRRDTSAYIKPVFRNGAEYLVWHDSETDIEQGDLSWQAHFDETYVPYHKEPEIRPKEAGEVWKNKRDKFIYMTKMGERYEGLLMIPSEKDLFSSNPAKEVIHGQNGWERLFSPVQDNDIERVSIKLSKAEIQSKLTRVDHAEGLILQLPSDHDGRNTWLLNYGKGAVAEELRNTDNDKRKERGYSPRKLVWDEETECLANI